MDVTFRNSYAMVPEGPDSETLGWEGGFEIADLTLRHDDARWLCGHRYALGLLTQVSPSEPATLARGLDTRARMHDRDAWGVHRGY